MNKLVYAVFVLCLQVGILSSFQPGQEAVVSVPIADALAYAQGIDAFSKSLRDSSYTHIPYTGEYPQTYSCHRLHQLLFNERVIIKKVTETQVKCTLPSVILFKNKHDIPQTLEVWTLKKNLMPIAKLGPNLTPCAIPEVYTADQKNIITLTHPWFDAEDNKLFSAGTRFVAYQPHADIPQQKKRNNRNCSYTVIIPDYLAESVKQKRIPTQLALSSSYKTAQQKQKFFILLLRSWAHTGSGILPYVWGGASFSNALDSNDFSVQEIMVHGEQHLGWVRPGEHPTPLNGCDCSSVILRIAQICGMPYFYKNCHSLSRGLKPLGADETLEEGDLFWHAGHVLIVSSVKDNFIIEAAGYGLGYGQLHEAPLHKIFKDIHTYDELVERFRSGQHVTRLKKDGSLRYHIHEYALLKLNSIF